MKSRVVTFVMAMCLMAVVAGQAEAARRPFFSSRVQASGAGSVIAGESFDVISLLKLWKSGYRYYLKF